MSWEHLFARAPEKFLRILRHFVKFDIKVTKNARIFKWRNAWNRICSHYNMIHITINDHYVISYRHIIPTPSRLNSRAIEGLRIHQIKFKSIHSHVTANVSVELRACRLPLTGLMLTHSALKSVILRVPSMWGSRAKMRHQGAPGHTPI